MESSYENEAEWISTGLRSARLEHTAMLHVLIRKKLITPEEYLNELNDVLSDDFVYSVRTFVSQSEEQLRNGPWHVGGAAATEWLARRLGLDSEDRVLDVGCGIGGPARQLAQDFGCTIVGVDIRVDRIVEAMLRTTALGLGDRASFQVGEGERLPFEDGAFNVVISQGTWNHVPNKRGLAREAFRVLKSGGRLGVECEALTDAATPESDETQTQLFGIAKWRELIDASGFAKIEMKEMWDESLEFYRGGLEREQIERGERVSVRMIARKP